MSKHPEMSAEEIEIDRRWEEEQKAIQRTPLDRWNPFISTVRHTSQTMHGPKQEGWKNPWAKFAKCIVDLADYATELEQELERLR